MRIYFSATFPIEERIVCGGMRASRPTLFTVVRSFKTMVTREIGYSVWQDSFYDKVIDSVEGYEEVWEYIEENPFKWISGKGDDY